MTTFAKTSAYGTITLELELPELTGSERQVAAAADIRNKAIKAFIETYTSNPRDLQVFNADKAKSVATLQSIVAKATAKNWLDARSVRGLVQMGVR